MILLPGELKGRKIIDAYFETDQRLILEFEDGKKVALQGISIEDEITGKTIILDSLQIESVV